MISHLASKIDLFIHPGEYEFGDENFCIRTTLGSCVSIVLWHAVRRVGGMCHCMLPCRNREANEPLNGKYADEALELLVAEARKAGTRPEDYQVKLFGGGNMFRNYPNSGSSVAVRNVDAVRGLISSAGLQIKSECLGGFGYRNVIFDIASGDVWVRRVDNGLSTRVLTPVGELEKINV